MPGGTPQTLYPFLSRAVELYPDTEVVARTAEGRRRRTYGEYAERVATLASALDAAGIDERDRVATFCWNHDRHFETYFAVPSMGAQLHTINPLLPVHHVRYIVENAADRLVFVDPSLLDPLEAAYDGGHESFDSVEQFVVAAPEVPETTLDPVVDYESFLDGHDGSYDWPALSGDQPAGMCYTSGTTGDPKGVEYTQSMLWAHTMAALPQAGLDVGDDDVVMPVVPMFHVNAWGLPFATTAAGATHVYPGPAPSPADLATLVEEEGVTLAAGVPTVWFGFLDYLDEHEVDLSTLERVVIGGSAAPESVIRRFDDLGVEVVHAWGMTEMAPVGTVSNLKPGMDEWDAERRYEKRTKQGLFVPGLEWKLLGDDGETVPADGESFGELLVRGPWVTTEYFASPEANETDFEDGYLRTGDVVTVDEDGYVELVDRAADVIKSGGEWISSVELENALMAHEDVAEATVVGVPHERWQERPVAVVVPREGADTTGLSEALRGMVREDYPEWWAPDEVVFVDEVPKTATGKFDKRAVREEYGDGSLVEGSVPEDAAPDERE
jgi:fatty-acyl-CoA synthase